MWWFKDKQNKYARELDWDPICSFLYSEIKIKRIRPISRIIKDIRLKWSLKRYWWFRNELSWNEYIWSLNSFYLGEKKFWLASSQRRWRIVKKRMARTHSSRIRSWKKEIKKLNRIVRCITSRKSSHIGLKILSIYLLI